jgi:hypothetical protein
MFAEHFRHIAVEEQDVQLIMVQELQEMAPVAAETVRYVESGHTQLVKSGFKMRGEEQLRHSYALGP